MKVRYAVPHFLMPRRVARVVALALFALCQGGTVEPGLARSSVAPAPQHHRSGAHRLTVDPSCFGSFSSCEISPGQQLQTTFGPASGACAMHTVAVDTSPWVHVSFNPVNLQSGQSSVVTISAGIPNIANGQGGGGQAGYTCGSLSPPVPVSIDFDPMPEPPCPPCASAPGNAAPPQPYVGGPVNVATGQDHYAATDVAFEGPFGIAFTRTYDSLLIGTQTVNSTTYGPSSLGSAGWQTNYDAYLYNDSGNNRFVLHDESGQFHYLASPAAGASAYSSVSGMTLSSNSAQTQYTVTAWTGQKWTFNSLGAMISKTDRTGNVQTITRDTTSGNNDRILNVADPLGRKLCYFYDSTNRITALVWEPSGTCPTSVPSSGTIVKLAYDSGTNCTTGQLCSVTEPDGAKWTYQYNNADATFPNGLIAVVNPRGDYEEQTTYAAGQVATQMTGNCSTYPCADTGGMLSFTYPNNGASQTVVTDGLGRTTTYSYDLTTYELLGVSGFLCGCGGDQTRTYTYDGYERLTSVADDGNGNGAHTITLNYGRDANGNAYPGPTSVVENVDNSGTQRTTSYTYYPIGDPRQDLAETTTLPSVDLGGTSTMSVNDTFATNGLLTQRTKTGYINGTSTSYTWKWSFDSRGRLLQATGPRSTSPAEVTKDVYYPDTDANTSLAGQLDTETDALGHVKHYATVSGYTAYTPFGSPESVTDVNGVPTGMTYDARGRLLTSTLNVGGTSPLVTTWAYDTVGRVTKKALPAGNGFTTTYDTSERQKAVIKLDASGLQHEQLVTAYNANDQVVSKTAQQCTTPAASCSTWATKWSESYLYSSTTGDLSSIVNALGTAKTLTYTPAGGTATINDENHKTGSDYTFSYDAAGRRIKESRYLASANPIVTSYTYDLHDNIATVTDPNANVTTYHNDDFDRTVKETSPVQGVTSYVFDADSNLTSFTDADASTTKYTYDSLNRPLSEAATKSGTTLTSNWTYDDATAGHYGINRLATMTDPSGSTAFSYELRGNVAVENRTIVGQSFTQAYTYDANVNPVTLTYPDGYVVTTGYDFADRPYTSAHTSTLTASQLTALSQSGLAAPTHTASPEAAKRTETTASSRPIRRGMKGSRLSGIQPGLVRRAATVSPDSFVTNATYEPFGPITSITFGNTTTQTLTYNARYFPLVNKLAGSTTLAEYTYAEDNVGNVTSITDNVNANYDRKFSYDDLNRLTTANSGTSLWGTATGNGFTYDAMSDIKTIALGTVDKRTFSYTAGASGSAGLPKIKSVVDNGTTRTQTYDAFGNTTNDGESTFTYSPRELTATDSRFISAYYYDGLRRRVATTLSSDGDQRDSFFDWKQHLLAETALFASGATPTIAYKYVWLGNRPVAQVDSGGTHWTFADFIGTPSIQTNSSAAITYQAEYEPFGEVLTTRTGATLHQPLRFPGQTAEQFDTGNNGLTERSYNGNRWYRPGWGRFSQPDPYGVISKPSLFAIDHQRAWSAKHARPELLGEYSGNLFEYANSDPARYTDPRGLASLNSFKLWGNFCGPGYTNGQFIPTSKFVGHCNDMGGNQDKDARNKPIDGLDSCCMTHDRCHCNCITTNKCRFSQGVCKGGCDCAISWCTLWVDPEQDHWGNPGLIAGETAAALGILDFMCPDSAEAHAVTDF